MRVMCTILIEFSVTKKVARLIKMYMIETDNEICVDEYLSNNFLILNNT
jgi:hypothetical protein